MNPSLWLNFQNGDKNDVFNCLAHKIRLFTELSFHFTIPFFSKIFCFEKLLIQEWVPALIFAETKLSFRWVKPPSPTRIRARSIIKAGWRPLDNKQSSVLIGNALIGNKSSFSGNYLCSHREQTKNLRDSKKKIHFFDWKNQLFDFVSVSFAIQ